MNKTLDDFELVIFDCDGTLVDSELLYNTVISEILIEAGLKQYTPETCLELFTGLTMSAIREKIEQSDKADLSNILSSDNYIGRSQAKMNKGLSPIAGASQLLEQCKTRNKICVASNGERSSVIKSLNMTGLYDYFGGHDDHIFTKIQVKNAKPAPDLFLYAAEKMGTAPQNCLVIEDSHAGVMAGCAANMCVWGYSGSHHDPENHSKALLKTGAHRAFDNLIHMTNASIA